MCVRPIDHRDPPARTPKGWLQGRRRHAERVARTVPWKTHRPPPLEPAKAARRVLSLATKFAEPAAVLAWAAGACDTSAERVARGRHHRRESTARWIAAYVLRHRLCWSYPRIAAQLGMPSHATAHSAVRRIAKLLAA